MAEQITNLEVDPKENEESTTNEAVKWLFEMEMVTDPNVHNVLILNIHKSSKYIQKVELVIDSGNKSMLAYLELSRWGMWRHKEPIRDAVQELLTQALPSYRFRVIYDASILAKAIAIVEKRK